MASHELDYRILGESMQTVEIELDPGETVIAEAGAMNYMTGDIRFTARMGDGSDGSLLGKLWSAGKRKRWRSTTWPSIRSARASSRRWCSTGYRRATAASPGTCWTVPG